MTESDIPPFGVKRFFRRGPLVLEWVGSWNRPIYPMFGAWRAPGGFTLRVRGLLLGWWSR